MPLFGKHMCGPIPGGDHIGKPRRPQRLDRDQLIHIRARFHPARAQVYHQPRRGIRIRRKVDPVAAIQRVIAVAFLQRVIAAQVP